MQDKKTQTLFERYGVENPSQLQEVKDKKAKTSLENWGTENPNQCEEIQERSKQTCLEKYGTEYYYQSDQFKNHIKDYRFPTQSKGELEIFDFLKSIKNLEIEQGDRSVLRGKELDILIKNKNVAIEYCGLYWHSTKFRNNNYHKEKFNECQSKGIQLITIFEDEWLKNKSLIKNKLSNILDFGCSKQLNINEYEIKLLNNEEKSDFYNNNHVQGDCKYSINIGLYQDSELVSCMSFNKRKHNIFYLERFGSKQIITDDFVILLEYFKNNFEWTKINVSIDLQWCDNKIYEENGFVFDKILNPDFSYFINNKRIKKADFNRSSSEKNIEEILKIYDCGKMLYKLTKEY